MEKHHISKGFVNDGNILTYQGLVDSGKVLVDLNANEDGARVIATTNAKSYDLDGITDYLNIQNDKVRNILSYNAGFSISMWIKTGRISNSGTLLSFQNDNSDVFLEVDFIRSGNGTIRGFFGASDKVIQANDWNRFYRDKWNHLVITTRRNNFARLYINGVVVASRNDVGTGSRPNSKPFVFGAKVSDLLNPSAHEKVKFDDIIFWNKALDTIPINQLYNTGVYRSPMLHSLFDTNAKLWLNPDTDVAAENQPYQGLFNSKNGEIIGSLVGLSSDFREYSDDRPQ